MSRKYRYVFNADLGTLKFDLISTNVITPKVFKFNNPWLSRDLTFSIMVYDEVEYKPEDYRGAVGTGKLVFQVPRRVTTPGNQWPTWNGEWDSLDEWKITGLWLQTIESGSVPGAPVTNTFFWGYDKAKREYIGPTWPSP